MTSHFTQGPKIIPIFKPARLSSNFVVGYFKKNLNFDYGKIGHFGTLDPFASGLLLIGISGATKLNDYIHEFFPKTYLAVGKLGIHTECLDYTGEIAAVDDSLFFKTEIPRYQLDFLNKVIQEKFLGTYLQAPQYYSAAKFQGRPLYEWARQGVLVKKEEKQREILDLKILKFAFPYITFECTVSSGTYVRTLFKDIANFLGTHGILISLTRTQIGPLHFSQSVKKSQWPIKNQRFLDLNYYKSIEEMLPLSVVELNLDQAKNMKNGQTVNMEDVVIQQPEKIVSHDKFWLKDKEIFGMAKKEDQLLRVEFNFPLSSS